jgi:D-alanyl-D-alanine carboxypeptidase/D-alanyl-D-alanine-endopeptidase (penicillin-binding protein 4)
VNESADAIIRKIVMSRVRYLVAFAIWIAILPAFAANNAKTHPNGKLARDIRTILDNGDGMHGFWGIYAVSIDSGRTIFALNQDKLFTPASNAKLFTTAAVFGLIGPDYRFKTTVETLGTLDRYGRLNSDLVLVGRGDPNLSGRALPYSMHTERKTPPILVLQELADQLVHHGLKYVDGDVVADDSYFIWERYGEGWSQDDLAREWGAPVSALTVNDNVIFVNIMPADRPGERAFLNVTPYPEYYKIDNRVMTTPLGSGPRTVSINREPGSNLVTFWGNIPQDDPGFGEALAIDDPADFSARLFRQLLEERGVIIYGRTRTRHTELASTQTFSATSLASGGGDATHATNPPPLVLASYQSQPVAQDLRVINKVSQNLHAELMLRLLGKERGPSGSIEAGIEVLRGFLVNAGVKPDQFAFYDGSGLSREDLVTPDAIVTLLRYCRAQPWGQAYVDTLPIAGTDGSLADRFRNTVAAGVVRAKTGSLTHVYALAGYATTRAGDHIAFSVMTNNNNMPTKETLETIDNVVVRLVEDK